MPHRPFEIETGGPALGDGLLRSGLDAQPKQGPYWWVAAGHRHGGRFLRDISRAHHATLTGATAKWVPGYRGRLGVDCNRTTPAYLVTAGNIALNGLTACTLFVSGVVRSYQTSSPFITNCIESGVAAGAGSRYFGLRFGDATLAGNARPTAYVRTSAATDISATLSTAFPAGSRFWLGATFGGNQLRLYVNGVLAAGPTATSGTLNTTQPLYLGNTTAYGGATRALDGVIEEAMLWPGVALPPAAMFELYRDARLGHPRMLRRTAWESYLLPDAAAAATVQMNFETTTNADKWLALGTPWNFTTNVGSTGVEVLNEELEFTTETELRAFSGGSIEAGPGVGPAEFETVTIVGQQVFMSPPVLLSFTTVTAVAQEYEVNEPVEYTTVTGARVKVVFRPDGRRDLLDDRRYRR